MKKGRPQRTFKDILHSSRPDSRESLLIRVRKANSIAKICPSQKSRTAAYKAKDQSLNHGLSRGLFIGRSDEEGRSHLLRVGTKSRSVHMPIGNLSPESRLLPGVQAVLGYGPRSVG